MRRSAPALSRLINIFIAALRSSCADVWERENHDQVWESQRGQDHLLMSCSLIGKTPFFGSGLYQFKSDRLRYYILLY